MERKTDLKSHVQKKNKGKWNGGKKKHYSYEGKQYRGGKKEKTPNLIKTEDGDLINQHGVVFTAEEKRKLESAVNTVNRKRKKMLEFEASLPRSVGGVVKEETREGIQAMGSESDFVLARRSKSLHRFKSKEQFNAFMESLSKVRGKDYISYRASKYRENHIQALKNVFGHSADDVIKHIESLSIKKYMTLLTSDEDLEVQYVYDPSQAEGKLNTIRTALGLKQKETPV